MNKKITRLIAALALLLFIAPPMVGWGQTRTEVTDVMNQTWTGVTGTTYTQVTGLEGSASDAVYTVQCAGDKSSIQLRSNNNNSGIVSTSSGGIVTNVSVNWNSETSNGRTLNIYGKNSAYSSASDLYNNNTQGTLLGTIVKGTSTSLEISGSYEYIGMRSASGAMYITEIDVTWETGGSTGPTTYSVIYDANGGTGTMVDESSPYEAGVEVTLLTNTFTAPEGKIWDSWEVKDAGNNVITVTNGEFTMPASDVTVKALWIDDPNAPQITWVLTSLADLTENDVFVIVGNNGSNYAMSNNNGTGSAPATVAVTVENDVITSTVDGNIQWTVNGNATNGYTFYPNGSTTTWLYCNTTSGSGSNNNIRVGTGNRKIFELDSDYYLVTKDDYVNRYLSIFSNSDWRGYINTTNGAVAISFYKKVTGGVVPPSISADNVSIEYNVISGNIEYTINNGVEGGTLSAATESDWLNLGQGTASPISFTCTANQAGTARTATVTLSYSYNRETVTKDVTVTQAGNPNYTMTIAEVRAQGTGAVVTKGTITSISGNGTKTAYIQDATAAIVVYGSFTAAVGDEIRVSGTLYDYNGLLEIQNPSVTILSSGNTINPELMTVAEVVASENQGWYIRIENATVTAISDKNVTIAQGESSIVVRFASADDITFEAEDVISLNGNIGYYNANQIANPQNVQVQEAAELTITPATVTIPQTGSVSGSFEVTTNITGMFGGYVYYYAPENLETPIDEPDWYTINYNYDSETLNISYVSTLANNTYEARTVCFKYFAMCDQGLVPSNVVTVTQEGKPLPIITIDPLAYTFNADEHNGTIEVAYENVATEAGLSIYWYEADGETTATYDWIYAEINTENNVAYMIGANDGEARTAYFKVYGLDAYASDVWSGLVTISQEAYVIDYAELPFAYDGNGLGTLPNGLTQEGLTDNYTSSPKMKFDGTGDWLLLHFNERPGTLTFNIKGNGFSGGTFKVQTSEDGVTYTDLETYTELGNTQNESFDNLGENVRYIKWIYTEKVNGNVALGNITLAEVVPSITITPDLVNVDADEHDGTLNLAYENLTITSMTDFAIQYYDAEGEELTEDPDWIEVTVAEQDPAVGEGYVVSYHMIENDGEARSAYFKVFVAGGEDFVYSNLVTVSQAAPVVPFTGTTYTLATTIESGRHYIITNGSDRAMGGQGNNNRAAVEINTVENVAQVDSDDVVELVINGPDANGFYTIYDANVPGYLYAAGGTSSNYLKTETFCDNKGQWTISFDAETSAASIVANISGNNARKTMKYNSGSDIFSCYSGGQQAVYLYLKDEETPQYDFYKDIAGYGQAENGNYYLIASPIDDADPVAAGMITDELGAQATPETSTYDLYWFDQTQDEEWQNYRQGTFKLASGMGYLYANKENKTIHFTGTPYDGNGEVSLVKDDEAQLKGWNLVGNPFGVPAYIDRDFYKMNPQTGAELIQSSGEIAVMQGIFVIAGEDGENLTFTPEATDQSANLTLNLSQSRGAVIDRAIVRFGEGRQLPKFQLNPNSTKVYIPQGAEDFAVVRSNAQGEMPVNFKAQNNGTYTISVNTENLEANYLHLIDNMTGTNIDLLQTPSYTFEAKTTDYASRFRLVFNVTGVEENTTSTEPFAFFNGSEWVVSNMGEATLQVVDMLGRIVSSETVNGNATMSTANLGAGVYVMRLVNGENVMTQKIVVK